MTAPAPTDGAEAAAAVARARAKLAAAQARQPAVTSLVARLARHLEDNHFAERLDAAFKRPPGEDRQ
jgi:hypothetical protein